nr:hypothetical protein [Tanacetum cinerariifolium]
MVNTYAIGFHKDEFCIHIDNGIPSKANIKQALRGSYALSWKPCQGDSPKLNLPDHSLIPAEFNSLPHAHAQATKTYNMHQDPRIKKAQELKTKTSATLIFKIFLKDIKIIKTKIIKGDWITQLKKIYEEDLKHDIVMVKMPSCMSFLGCTNAYDEPIGNLDKIRDKAENLSQQSTPQVLPSFEKYITSMTYPKEVKETLGTPMEVEPLDQIKLEDVGLNNHNIPISYKEVPIFDEPEPQPQPLPSSLTKSSSSKGDVLEDDDLGWGGLSPNVTFKDFDFHRVFVKNYIGFTILRYPKKTPSYDFGQSW